MEYLKIKDWEKWQSYRSDRGQPPWIKIHRRVMRNIEWVSMNDSERGQLVAIWLLAADHDGVIPASPELIKQLCYMTETPNINKFIELGFICAEVASTRRQYDANMTHQTRLEKTREEKNKNSSNPDGFKFKINVPIPKNIYLTKRMEKYIKKQGCDNSGYAESLFEKFCIYQGKKNNKWADWTLAFYDWVKKDKAEYNPDKYVIKVYDK